MKKLVSIYRQDPLSGQPKFGWIPSLGLADSWQADSPSIRTKRPDTEFGRILGQAETSGYRVWPDADAETAGYRVRPDTGVQAVSPGI